jgi:hypothetical protein
MDEFELLLSYAKFFGISMHSEYMHNMETILINEVSSGIGDEVPEDIKVALAGIIVCSVSYTQARISSGHGSKKEFDVKRLIEKLAIKEAADWVVKRRYGTTSFGKENVATEAKIITELLKQNF